jgi:membrane-bound ClpP family serine protease
MNKGNEQTATPSSSKGNGLRFIPRRLLQPRAVLFLVTLGYCVSEFVRAMQEKENPFVFSQWMFVRDLMVAPLLMLITSVLILIHRLSTTALAMAIAGYLIYVTAYRGMISIPDSHGVPILSFDALRIWFEAMPDNLILLAAFASVALVFGTLQLWRLLRPRRKHLS